MRSAHEAHVLTKSTFLRGLRCGKSLMLDALRDELRDPPDDEARMRMLQGQEVGRVAQRRYPGGETGRMPGANPLSLQRTQDLIEAGTKEIYEAAFQHDGVFILVDILVQGEVGWRLIEVKSTSKVDDEHLWDVAVQAHVLSGAGVTLEDVCLLHVNSDYVRQGEIDPQTLFTEASLMREALESDAIVRQSVAESCALIAGGEVPGIDIGPHCNDPRECDFKGHCWQHLPSPSVFDVYYIGKKAFDLYGEGITRIEEIPDDFDIGKRSRFHVRAHKSGEMIVKREELRTFIDSLEYPIFHLDFETINPPIPPWDGLSPYNQIPFQYSLHLQVEPGAEPVHSGFLAEAGVDPRREFLDSLLPATEGTGSILAYYVSFERGVMKALAEQFPEHADAIEQRIERLVDLRDPFGKQWLHAPAMGGSTSLKAVLPALVPELSYDALEIKDGRQAMRVFLSLADQVGSTAYEAERKNLWEYCKLDTLAMVRILDVLMGHL
jgi:hypothetical protein